MPAPTSRVLGLKTCTTAAQPHSSVYKVVSGDQTLVQKPHTQTVYFKFYINKARYKLNDKGLTCDLKVCFGAEVMPQWLTVLAALSENLGLI